ncbi:MAG: hypothetical protein JWR37_46 [Mycobacterium sp.]|jgi:NAD(P)-dependent dehydrogenase (short-subunit alcohol dehydrogenase family)|nr:hypothetical protein [Mycobacterium sp.]
MAGIGYAIALQLAKDGAEVIAHGRNAERGAKTYVSTKMQAAKQVS